MRKFNFKITAKESGKQIKSILCGKFGISASVLTKLKKDPDGILLNGERVYSTQRVSEGDLIELNLNDIPSINIEPVQIPLDIIYEDEDILIVNKPSDMPIHPSQNHHNDTLANAVMYYYREEDFTFRVITRLDKDTTGVVLIAKNKISASLLTKSMTAGNIKKEYVALCHNRLPDVKGEINAPIGRKEGSAIEREVSEKGKDALTLYEVIEEGNELSLVKLKPITGRTHQIRVHLSFLGCPIFGDDLYGSPVKNERCRLHCRELSFRHPITNKEIKINADIPDDMK